MKPKQAFDTAMKRAERLLDLYDLLTNKRRRSTRSDWAKRFKAFMRWPNGETIHRVDGMHALLILRQKAGLTAREFREDELNELLRAALVVSTSALDRYCHEVLISRVMKQIGRSQKKWPRALRGVALPLADVKNAVTHARIRKGQGGHIRTRPMVIIRHALQDQFHRELTLQRPDEIARAWSMIGINDLWSECAKHMGEKSQSITGRLNRIITRRNQMVHEGDIRRLRRGGHVSLNVLAPETIKQDIRWLASLGATLDSKIVIR